MPTGIGGMHQLAPFDWSPHQLVAVHVLPDFASWQDVVNRMKANVDIILVLSYQGLRRSKTDNALVPGPEITRWLNDVAKPSALGISPDYVEDGGMLAVYPSGSRMGELAAIYALDWLRTAYKEKLPLIESGSFRVGLRESMLRERKLMLPRIYAEAAHLENFYYP